MAISRNSIIILGIVATFILGIISANPIAEAVNPVLSQIQTTLGLVQTETDKIESRTTITSVFGTPFLTTAPIVVSPIDNVGIAVLSVKNPTAGSITLTVQSAVNGVSFTDLEVLTVAAGSTVNRTYAVNGLKLISSAIGLEVFARVMT